MPSASLEPVPFIAIDAPSVELKVPLMTATGRETTFTTADRRSVTLPSETITTTVNVPNLEYTCERAKLLPLSASGPEEPSP